MPESFMVFDFGENEDAAQQARHRLEAWRQAFRLGDRLKFKFERTTPEPAAASSADTSAEASPAAGDKPAPKMKTQSKSKSSKNKTEAGDPPKSLDEAASPAPATPDHFRLVVRLEFPLHEKLSFQRWFDRLPAEAPFESTEKRILRPNQDGFESTAELFDKLD